SGLPSLLTALASQLAAALAALSHFLMDESLAAPLSGLPSLLTALASQLPGAGAAFAAGAAGAAFAAGVAGAAGAAGAVACAKARDAVKRVAPNTATICFIMISLLN